MRSLPAWPSSQQALDRHNCSGGPARLEVRIGLSAGDVTVEEADCFGTPVIEAARLCALAEGGQILASEIVRALAGSAGGHRFRPVGALDLKGLPVPVATCEVAWESLPVAAVPLPALLTDIGRVFVGRDAELGQLGQLWKQATAGERPGERPVVAGEPGGGQDAPVGCDRTRPGDGDEAQQSVQDASLKETHT